MLGGLYSSYYQPGRFYNPYNGEPPAAQQRAMTQYEREERYFSRQQRRSKYLPSDDEESSDEGSYLYGCTPRERIHRDGRRRREAYEGRRREEEIYNQKRQEQARQEQLLRDEEKRWQEQQMQEQRQRQQCKQPPHPQRPRSVSRPPQKGRAPSLPPAPTTPAAPPSPPVSTPPAPPVLCVSPTPPPPPETLAGPPMQPPQPVPSHERLEEAAKTIQIAYRIRRSFDALRDLEREFKYLKDNFSLPKRIDFLGPDGRIISVTPPEALPIDAPISADEEPIPVPELTFDKTNYDLLSYIESLSRLLTRLDGVESWGDAIVRQRRRRIVSRVEAEANRVEAYLKQGWLTHIAEESKAEKGTMEG